MFYDIISWEMATRPKFFDRTLVAHFVLYKYIKLLKAPYKDF